MAKPPKSDPCLEEGQNMPPGKIVKRSDLVSTRARPEFPKEPRDPWRWISLALSLLALVGAIVSWCRP